MNTDTIAKILEALLMVADAPLELEKLHQLIGEEDINIEMIKQALDALQSFYSDRGIELVKVASGYRFQAKASYQEWFHRLLEEKPQRYSKALLETLAIVAYRQPVTRADVEAIRGVAVSSGIMKTLLEREWVRVVGHRDVPGKPSIYATTKAFLDYFGLCALNELPPLADIKDISELMQQGDDVVADLGLELTPQKINVEDDPLKHIEAQPKDAGPLLITQDEDTTKAIS